MAVSFSGFSSLLHSAFGETVTYSRGSSTCELSAIRGEQSVTGENAGGVIVTFTTLVFWMKKSDMLFDSVAIEPTKGDKITDDIGVVYDYAGGAEYEHETAEWKIPVVRAD